MSERRPEQSVQGVQHWARSLAFEHGKLLSKGKDFKGSVASALAEDADDRDHGQDEFTHEFSLVPRRNAPCQCDRDESQPIDSTSSRSSVYAQPGPQWNQPDPRDLSLRMLGG